MDEDEKLMALIYIDKKVGEYLFAVSQVNEKRPTWNGKVADQTTKVLETALNAHRQGGVASGQLMSVEGSIAELDDILEGRK